jgi:hypothetical protein
MVVGFHPFPLLSTLMPKQKKEAPITEEDKKFEERRDRLLEKLSELIKSKFCNLGSQNHHLIPLF